MTSPLQEGITQLLVHLTPKELQNPACPKPPRVPGTREPLPTLMSSADLSTHADGCRLADLVRASLAQARIREGVLSTETMAAFERTLITGGQSQDGDCMVLELSWETESPNPKYDTLKAAHDRATASYEAAFAVYATEAEAYVRKCLEAREAAERATYETLKAKYG